jgi:hypothetical protein
LDLTAVLQRLRDMRPKGAAEKIRKASSMRVRVIPTDEELQHWLDRLEPFHQWVFGCIATYGLRPHELWHAEGIDRQGWITLLAALLLALITLSGLRPTASTPLMTMSISQDDFLLSIYRSKQKFLASLPPWRRP